MAKKTVILTLGRHAASGQARVSIAGRHVYLGKYGSPEAAGSGIFGLGLPGKARMSQSDPSHRVRITLSAAPAEIVGLVPQVAGGSRGKLTHGELPYSVSNRTILGCLRPISAAAFPLLLRALRSAPCASSHCTASVLPFRAKYISSVP